MKLVERLILITIPLLLCLMVLAGCQNQSEPDNATSADEQTQIQMNIVDGKKVIVDCLGRTVEIPEQINKIAAMHIYGVKMIFAMQLQDKAAFQLGIGHDFDKMAELDEFYASLPASPAQGNGSTITESLLALDVNLVLTNANNGPEEADTYTNAGIAAIAVQGETFDQVYETARLLGFIFDCDDRAEELINFINAKLETVTQRVADIKDKDKPVVMVCGTGGIYTCASSEMFQDEMIETAGGINAGQDLPGSQWAKINAEDIISWDPDYIILSNSCTEADLEEILNDPALSTVSAVKNGQVYIFPSTLGWWDFPLPQSMLGIIWTATIIHPDIFSDIDMLSLANEIYLFMYGYSYSELGGTL